MKIKSMQLVTPNGVVNIIVNNNHFENKEELEIFLEEWKDVLLNGEFFRLPTNDNQVCLLPKEVLKKSYIFINLEGKFNND